MILTWVNSTVLRVTTFWRLYQDFLKSQPDLCVIKQCAKVHLYGSNDLAYVRKSASWLEMQGELFNVRGRLFVSYMRRRERERESIRNAEPKNCTHGSKVKKHNWRSGVKFMFRLWILLKFFPCKSLPERYILDIQARHSWHFWKEAKTCCETSPFFLLLNLNPLGAQASLGRLRFGTRWLHHKTVYF